MKPCRNILARAFRTAPTPLKQRCGVVRQALPHVTEKELATGLSLERRIEIAKARALEYSRRAAKEELCDLLAMTYRHMVCRLEKELKDGAVAQCRAPSVSVIAGSEVGGLTPPRPTTRVKDGDVAQTGEHLSGRQNVAGSTPVVSTTGVSNAG